MKRITLLISLLTFTLFGFSQQHLNVTFPSDTFTLAATLSIPNGAGPFPVIILVHGSGPNDRDQTVSLSGGNFPCLYPNLVNKTIKNFKDLAISFSAKGYAVLRYDKRSFTHGAKLDPKTISPYDFVKDIHSAVDFVKGRSEIDTSCIVLLGHSQGGNFIPIVADQRSDIYALLSLGTAAQGIDSIIALQGRDLYYKCLKDTNGGNNQYNNSIAEFKKIRNGTADPNTPISGVYPKFWSDWIDITDSAIINYQRINHPTLLLHASEDFNIPYENAKRFESQVTRGGFDIYFLDGLNHYFTNATVPTVQSEVSDTIISWLKMVKLKSSVAYNQDDVNQFSLYNNNSQIKLQFEVEKTSISYKVFGIEGRLIKSAQINNDNSIILDKSEFPNGTYIISGIAEGNMFSARFIISD